MNTLIANQYGRVQGEVVGGTGLTLAVAAQTPRRESVQLQTRIDSVEQLLHLLAIMRAVERRIEQFKLRDAKSQRPTNRRASLTRQAAPKATCSARTATRKTRSMAASTNFLSTSKWTRAGYASSLPSGTKQSASHVSTYIPERFWPSMR